KEFLAHVKTGDQAEQDGLLAKAAREYTAAWDGLNVREDIGFKAAKLWAERLNNPAEAARILNTIVAHPQDLDLSKQVKEMLEGLQDALQKVFDDKLQAGQQAMEKGQMDEAIKAFTLAAQVMPD